MPQIRRLARCGAVRQAHRALSRSKGGTWVLVGLALLAAVPAHAAADGGAGSRPPAGFFFESKSTLRSRRLRTPFETTRRAWLTDRKLRFDDGEQLTTLIDLDSGEVTILSRQTNTYIRQNLKNIGGALLELGETMARRVSGRVVRTRNIKEIGKKPCKQCRVELAGVPCSIWVQEDSRETFNAVRSLARAATRKMGGTRSALVTAFGGLGGVPREFVIGDPKQIEFQWTVTQLEPQVISNRMFDLPASAREDASVKAMAYKLPEDVYFCGEVTAGHFAPTPAQRSRSLMPKGMSITDEKVLKDFYEGREGAEQHAIFRWAKPLMFHLVPEMWCYPLSGRSANMLLLIGTCLRGGALRYYPAIEKIKMPAN